MKRLETLIVVIVLLLSSFILLQALSRENVEARDRDSARTKDITAYMIAIQESRLDNDGAFPFPERLAKEMPVTELGTCGKCIDLTKHLEPYLSPLPVDPTQGSEERSGYFVTVDTEEITTITAPHAEKREVKISR